MEKISYVIKDGLGIHARPAGQLVKAVAGFKSSAQVGVPGKMVDAKRIMAVMGLGVKKGDTITVTFDGPDEADAAAAVSAFLKDNL